MLYRKEQTYSIIGAAMEVHKELGCGFTEIVYQDVLEKEFILRKIPYEREKLLKVTYKGETLDRNFFADFVCYGDIIIELKAVRELLDIHRQQLISYMKTHHSQVGLLFNFGQTSLEYERKIQTY